LIIFSVVDFPEPEVPISTENAPSRADSGFSPPAGRQRLY
jgi:hypothetical protein